MRLLQLAIGMLVAIGLAWGYLTFYQGRALYTPMPPILDDIPWSENPKKPARVATIRFLKPCGEPQLADNATLVSCFTRLGMETGQADDGTWWATFSSGTGLMPSIHHIEWNSVTGELPMQVETYKEV